MQNAFPPLEVLQAWMGSRPPSQWRLAVGGYSGAQVWICDERVLKAHPLSFSDIHTLHRIHSWINGLVLSGLDCVAFTIPIDDGHSAIRCNGRLWEMSEFRKGQADFHANPNNKRLKDVMANLFRLHHIWSTEEHSTRLMPAVERRYRIFQLGLERWRNNRAMLDLIIRPEARDAGLIHLVKRIPELIERERLKLRTIEHLHVECHPCLCDIHHDHLLFTGDELTGLIDFSAAKIDHPAVDLARLFGSLFPDDKQRWREAFEMYGGGFPFEWIEILESSGLVGAAIFWFDKLLDNPKPDERVAKRVSEIVARLRE